MPNELFGSLIYSDKAIIALKLENLNYTGLFI